MGIPVFLPVVYRDLSGNWFGVTTERNRGAAGTVVRISDSYVANGGVCVGKPALYDAAE